MKSYNSGLAGGLKADERSTENQWSHHLNSKLFAQGVTAFKNNSNKTAVWAMKNEWMERNNAEKVRKDKTGGNNNQS